MKVLGWRVAFVRRSSATVVTLRNIYVDMKVWSCMFAVNVQCVSVQQVKWNLISCHTRTTNNFAVVYVVNMSNVYVVLKATSRDVLVSWELTMSGPPWREGNRKTINITLTFSILLRTVVIDCMNNLQDISTHKSNSVYHCERIWNVQFDGCWCLDLRHIYIDMKMWSHM